MFGRRTRSGDLPASRGSVLLLGNYMPSLSIARSLARAGFHVIGGNGGEYDILKSSRACHEIWRHSPVTSPDELMSDLAEFIGTRPDVRVIMPVQSRATELLARRRGELPPGLMVASPQADVVLACVSKPDLYAIAVDAGVPVASHGVATDLGELRSIATRVGYPLIVRPVDDARGALPDGRKAIACVHAAELDDAFPQWPDGHPEILVQRFVNGPRFSIYFVADGERAKVIAQSRTLRTDQSDGTGFGVLGQTLARPDERLASHVRSLAAALGYRGVGTAQFIAPDDGEVTLLEVNPRIGTGIRTLRHLPVDMPLIAVELALGRDEVDVEAIETPVGGATSAWSSRELFRTMVAWHERESGVGETIRSVGRALVTAFTVRRHATFDWRDPMPTVHLYAHLLRMALRRRQPATRESSR